MNKLVTTTFLAIGIIVAMLVETTLVGMPLVYFIGAFLLVFFRRVRVYVLVFILALMTDSLRVTNFGLTPLFLSGLCGILFLYEKYSGSDDKLVYSIFICASGIIYAHSLSYSVGLTLFLIVATAIGFFIFTNLKRRGVFFL